MILKQEKCLKYELSTLFQYLQMMFRWEENVLKIKVL